MSGGDPSLRVAAAAISNIDYDELRQNRREIRGAGRQQADGSSNSRSRLSLPSPPAHGTALRRPTALRYCDGTALRRRCTAVSFSSFCLLTHCPPALTAVSSCACLSVRLSVRLCVCLSICLSAPPPSAESPPVRRGRVAMRRAADAVAASTPTHPATAAGQCHTGTQATDASALARGFFFLPPLPPLCSSPPSVLTISVWTSDGRGAAAGKP